MATHNWSSAMARGPAYPYISLGDAIAVVRKIFDFTKRAPANLNALLKDKLRYSPTSSSAVKVVAALKYYGLADSAGGNVKESPETIKITDRAYRILVDSEDSPERKRALKEACLSPKAYRLCWDTWGAELPDSMRSTLIFTHQFNDSSVDGFLANYKKSIEFAGLMDATSTKEDGSERLNEKKLPPKVGDFVQWEHDGVLGLPKALRVAKISDDEEYAWVEGHTTGLPVSELIAADPPPVMEQKDSGSRVVQPQTGHFRIGGETSRAPIPKGGGMRQEVISLDEGDAVLQWPANIGKNSIEDVEEWVKFLLKRLKRSLELQQRGETQPTDKPK